MPQLDINTPPQHRHANGRAYTPPPPAPTPPLAWGQMTLLALGWLCGVGLGLAVGWLLGWWLGGR